MKSTLYNNSLGFSQYSTLNKTSTTSSSSSSSSSYGAPHQFLSPGAREATGAVLLISPSNPSIRQSLTLSMLRFAIKHKFLF